MRVVVGVLIGAFLLLFAAGLVQQFVVMSAFRGKPSEPLFAFDLEVLASLTVDGEAHESVRVYRCEIRQHFGTIDVPGPHRRAHQTPEDHLFVRPADGSLLVLGALAPCSGWLDEAPSAGVTYALVPTHRDEGVPDVGPAERAVRSSTAWLDNADAPRRAVLRSLAAVAAGDDPRIENLKILARLTDAPPSDAVADQLSMVKARLEAAAAATSLNERRAARSSTDAVIFQAAIGQLSELGVCRHLRPPLSGERWVLLEAAQGCSHSALRPVEVALGSSEAEVIIATAPRRWRQGVAVSVASVVETGAGSYEESDNENVALHYQWSQNICIEERCFAIPIRSGETNRWFAFYHPPTDRILVLSAAGTDLVYELIKSKPYNAHL